MAPKKARDGGGQVRLDAIISTLQSGTKTEKSTALENLEYVFSKGQGSLSQTTLDDKMYHGMYEALFRYIVSEKENFFSGKKNIKASASTKLANCAKVLRITVSHGAYTIRRNTVIAVIDHVAETLPGPDEEYIEPLLTDYVKILLALLQNPANVEHLTTVDGEGWLTCIDFVLQALSRYFDTVPDRVLSRGSPAPGTAQSLSIQLSVGRPFSPAIRSSSGVGLKLAEDLMQCVYCLVGCTNVPEEKRHKQTLDVILRTLRNKQISPSGLHRAAFGSICYILPRIQVDDLTLTKSLAQDLVPLITHWYQPRALARDAMLNSVREEVIKTVSGLHLYLKALVLQSPDDVIVSEVEELLDALWAEYSRREDRARLQLGDLTFSSAPLTDEHPNNGMAYLRPYDAPVELKWALLESIGFLETLLFQSRRKRQAQAPTEDEQPRKRRRIADESDRLRQKIKSLDPGVRLSAYQLIPFYFKYNAPTLDELSLTLEGLLAPLNDKQATVASWAMLAAASCAAQRESKADALAHIWRQIWKIALRSLSLPSTCRAASVLLHSVLDFNLVLSHDVSDDIVGIVSNADISGPAILLDSSLNLMRHLLRLRNRVSPSASQTTASNVIRWVFAKWKPGDSTYSSIHSLHATPFDLISLLHSCCGIAALGMAAPARPYGGPISQFQKGQRTIKPLVEYLLLLEETRATVSGYVTCTLASDPASESSIDSTTAHSTKRLVLELLAPVVEDLAQLSESWTRRGTEGSTQVSPERLQSAVLASLVGTLLLPLVTSLNTSLSRDLEVSVFRIVDALLEAALESSRTEEYLKLILTLIAPYMPAFTAGGMTSLRQEQRPLLRFFARISAAVQQKNSMASTRNGDKMDVDSDDEFESQGSHSSTTSKLTTLPRRDVYLYFTEPAFYLEITMKLEFLSTMESQEGQLGLVPASFVDQLVDLPHERLVLLKSLLAELFSSDLVITPDDALKVMMAMGKMIGEYDFSRCEAASSMCIGILEYFASLWTTESTPQIAKRASEFYRYYITKALPNNILSADAQIQLCQLLMFLLEIQPTYGGDLDLPSCRSVLLSIAKAAPMPVKYYIGSSLPKIFSLYVLKTHDDIFIDVLDSLPADPEDLEGIAFRLLALANLGCKWSTLLRRSIYHIFETPGRIRQSAQYATRCLSNISSSLSLAAPTEIFRLFAPQLLYTWLENDSIGNIPFEIFGFSTLEDLLSQARQEAAAIMIMRGQEDEVSSLAQKLGLTPAELMEESFAKVVAYSIAHDISMPNEGQPVTGEGRVRQLVGKEAFVDNVYLHFADIIAIFFDIFDQEGDIEKSLKKSQVFEYATSILQEIRKFGHLDTVLPPNQQPMFKAKYLTKEIAHLCKRTEFEVDTIWTPALVASVARKLLNTVHPALGPLHACSVLRKLRVLIAFAGPQALSSYPLEMLLHTVRRFIIDPECADDALGISQYLIHHGENHLRQVPSFFAGYALSTLADLRVFLESSQSSTTQESQFRATIGKAQMFHSWFTKHLASYSSTAFKNDIQRVSFQSITASAGEIRSSGNAEKDTHESNLLLEILEDGERDDQLLNGPAREVALSMLCGVFSIPQSARLDVIETDEAALDYSNVVWKSARADGLSSEYLSWAGRVVGRSFAASGEIPQGPLRESRLADYRKLADGNEGSEQCILKLLEALTVNSDFSTAGLAESALRTIISDAVAEKDDFLLVACQKGLSEALLSSSNWEPYRIPPSDYSATPITFDGDVFATEKLESPEWAQHLTVHLVQSVQDSVIMNVLRPILLKVPGFAEQAFAFIVHLVLLSEFERQQVVKSHISDALKKWLALDSAASKENLKLMFNTILYLRTQPIPNESSIADRVRWLDIDLQAAAAGATRCGMFKVALLFAELAVSETKTSRRSSVREVQDSTPDDVLLAIFENIDDPDAYYGLSQEASLSTVLSRLEYENDGMKSLAFRGAQFNSHVRRKDPARQEDAQSLVNALGSLGLFGISDSLLQAQQTLDTSPAALDSTFTTARRLETWNIPVPPSHESHAVTLYKAYRSIHQATDLSVIRNAVYEGLARTFKHLARQSLNPMALRRHLGALAALTELDDALNIVDYSDLEKVLSVFEERSKWMMSGRYDDVSSILSCRETTLSMLSQRNNLRNGSSPTAAEARLAQIRGMLLSSGIYRFHRASQESLNLSTSLTDLMQSSQAMGLNVDAAVKVEVANSLWDHNLREPSIRMLQSVDTQSSLKKQSVALSRSNLLSKIAHQVSVAKLESADSIQKQYLEPSLKELRGKNDGKDAGRVYHQFAVFCDQQLQDPDGLNDLQRLQNLKKGKSEEVQQYKRLISETKDTQQRNKLAGHLAKAKQWLDLDQQDLRQAEQARSEFVRLSLENYLLALTASDEHNNDALRFTAMWLERSGEDITNEAVKRQIDHVPTRKFAPLMNQLSSRLQDQSTLFQKLLYKLVLRICNDHPYHGMYQIWAGARNRTNTKDEVAVSRHKATEKVASQLVKTPNIAQIWQAIDRTSKAYYQLAMERDSSRYKAGQKMLLKESSAGHLLISTTAKYAIPPPTMQIELSAQMDYNEVPLIAKFEPNMSIASGVSAPKIITAVGTDGKRYKQLVKGGNDDLRQDAIMEQVFAAVSDLLKLHRKTRQRNLGIRTYKVLPLTSSTGLIEFVSDTIPLHEYLMPAHERYYPKDMKGSSCRKEISAVQTKSVETRISTYRKVTDRFHPVMRYFFLEYFEDPDDWFVKRTAYTRTTAAVSMLGHVLGLGDRHGHNILLDTKTGEVVHIDLGVAFEMGRVLPVPELVPFRMTRDIVDGMGITKTEGVFRRSCVFTMEALREDTYSIMTILDVLRFDPLYSWSISPVRLAKLQNARGTDDPDTGDDPSEMETKKTANEQSEADRALEVVRGKLSTTLNEAAVVNDLINQATDEKNLAVLYSGWAAYA